MSRESIDFFMVIGSRAEQSRAALSAEQDHFSFSSTGGSLPLKLAGSKDKIFDRQFCLGAVLLLNLRLC